MARYIRDKRNNYAILTFCIKKESRFFAAIADCIDCMEGIEFFDFSRTNSISDSPSYSRTYDYLI